MHDRAVFLLIAASSLLSYPASAQTPAAGATSAAADQDPVYKLSTTTRLVVEDISVTDLKGNLVKGLPKAAFHLEDDGLDQTIIDFGENTKAATPSHTLQSPAGTYSNASLYANQGVVTVMLVDPIGMELGDQMYLRLQMIQFLKTMPQGTEVVVFRSASRGAPVLIQSLTSDRSLLMAAVDHSVPTMSRPVSGTYANAIDELYNVSAYLRSVPGRKALLWFAGRFPLYVQPGFGAAGTGDNASQSEAYTREAFRALEQARIAVYPVDVRGVVNASVAYNPAGNTTAMANDPSTAPSPQASDAQQVGGSYNAMDDLAEATGGRAYYSQNELAKIITSAVETEQDSYTLSYRPNPYAADGKWHKVSLKVDGPYIAHYRKGYVAGDSIRPALTAGTGGDAGKPIKGNTMAAAGDVTSMSDSSEAPIIFEARVQVEAGARSHLQIQFAIPAKDLSFQTAADGTNHARFRVAAIAYNTSGDILSRTMDVIETHYTASQMEIAGRIGTPAKQTIDVAKGADFIMLAVEDLTTRRVGSLQLTTKSAASTPTSK